MRAMVCHRLSDDRSGLTFEPGWPEPPPPGPGEVTLAVGHAALNYPDVLMLSGGYQFAPPLPFVPGVEGAGTVIALGDGVDPALLGRAVVIGARFGLLAERATVPATALRPIPAGLAPAEAAAFTVAALTAYVALVRRGRLAAGERVTVAGASGGTGLAAVRLARALGATVTAVVSTPAKGEAAVAAGAGTIVIAGRVGPLPALPPADIVFDPVGGRLTAPLLASLARGGRYLVIGFVGGIGHGGTCRPRPRTALKSSASARANLPGATRPAASPNLAAIDRLAPRLVPHLGLRAPLAAAADAFAAMADGRLIGKAVVDL